MARSCDGGHACDSRQCVSHAARFAVPQSSRRARCGPAPVPAAPSSISGPRTNASPGAALPWRRPRQSTLSACTRATPRRAGAVASRRVGEVVAGARRGRSHRALAAVRPGGRRSPGAVLLPRCAAGYLQHIRDALGPPVMRIRSAALERQQIGVMKLVLLPRRGAEAHGGGRMAAGLAHVVLLEEPIAALYARIGGAAGAGRACARALVLVCDVGGGTTDFSLIRAERPGGGLNSNALPSASTCCSAATPRSRARGARREEAPAAAACRSPRGARVFAGSARRRRSACFRIPRRDL